MRKPQPKKNFQIRRMFGLAKAAHNWQNTKEYLEELAFVVTRERTSSLSDLTFDEANDVIVRLGGTAFAKYGQSKRTENYRKQQAGIKSIETENHLNFIDELARLRNMSPEGLEKMGTRMLKHWPPRTTSEGNKIVEALKAMNARDGLSVSGRQSAVSSQSEPKFRRVA